MKIIQFADVLDYGDGIANDIWSKHEFFQELGYQSVVCAIVVDKRLKDRASLFKDVKVKPGDIFLHHYSGFCSVMDKIREMKCTKVMIYHNVTPPEFMDGKTRDHCLLGIEQLKTLGDCFDYFAGDSQFNVDCLAEMGVSNKGDVLPIAVEFEDKKLERREKPAEDGKLFLFVGRIAQNKKIENVIRVFDYYHNHIDSNSKLCIPGNTKVSEEYTQSLLDLIDCLPSGNSISLMGKVSDEELLTLFSEADVYLSMSEHEGFGIPLLEAMNYRVPVVAYDTAAVGETMGNAGVLLKTNIPSVAARVIHQVLESKEIQEKIIEAQLKNLNRFKKNVVKERIALLLKKWQGQPVQVEPLFVEEAEEEPAFKTIQMQGPFETSYSLAIVNRKLIEAIHRTGVGDASIFCMEGTGAYTPDPMNLEDKPLAAELWEKGKRILMPDVALRNMYPPTDQPLNGKYNFQSFAWEEDRVPEKFVKDFNATLDGIGTTSSFVTETLKACGVTIPVETMGNGVELPAGYEDFAPYPLDTEKGTRFLHISSCFPRKGVDVLLKVYFETFTKVDDVCLVIKTFPNPHNTVPEQVEKLQKKYPDGPQVILINRDLPEEELFGLYKSCTCYVQSARGEGFGLPVAEAMLAKIPTIVCNNTGMADFSTEETCITVGFHMEKAASHVTENSRWAEPDAAELAQKMKRFAEKDPTLKVEEKIEKAYELISTYYTWDAVAKRWEAFIQKTIKEKKRPQVDLVTTWNSKCGIAEFMSYYVNASRHLADYHIYPDRVRQKIGRDQTYVEARTWEQYDKNMDGLLEALLKSENEIVHIQFNFSFFSVDSLARVTETLAANKKRVIIHLHAAKYFDDHINKNNKKAVIHGLNAAYAVIVHQPQEVELLTKHGVKKSVIRVLPHGLKTFPEVTLEEAREKLGLRNSPIIASYGFLLPHKGIEKTIRAIGILRETYPNILYIASCSLYDIDVSHEYYETCRNTITELGLENNVLLITDFLENEESMQILQSADCCVMAYDRTGESASGAVRFCIAAVRPLITTNQNIFKEFAECSYQIEDNSPEEIADGIEAVLTGGQQEYYQEKMRESIREMSWDTVSEMFAELYR
ncbi:MAG: glycosyltransferase [Lachnospiraceae bacterium]|nr:glycosyltransferase [Lachnospiraceae bacterium]